MRSKASRRLLILALALGSAACGGDAALTPAHIAQHLEKMDAHPSWGLEMPSDARVAELFPDANGESKREYRAKQLGEDPHARALLQAGPAILPELLEALNHDARRDAAAVLLREIGGEDAARGLLAAWRDVRDRSQELTILPAVGQPSHGSRVGDKSIFGGVVTTALCFAGRPVSDEIAADTITAIQSTEERRARGERLTWRETTPRGDRQVELVRYAHALDTAREGIRMLVMVGGAQVEPTLRRALDSPVRLLRAAALREAGYLGPESGPLLPRVVELLAHPDHGHAAHRVLTDVYRSLRAAPALDGDWAGEVEWWTKHIAVTPLPTGDI